MWNNTPGMFHDLDALLPHISSSHCQIFKYSLKVSVLDSGIGTDKIVFIQVPLWIDLLIPHQFSVWIKVDLQMFPASVQLSEHPKDSLPSNLQSALS